MEPNPLIGKKLGKYRIVEKIGQGGMADIYRGRIPRTNRDVAIKLIGQHLPADPALTQRFRREAQAAASLHHSHIIAVRGFGEYEGGHYMVMEYIKGTNLQRRIKYRYSRKQDFKPREVVTLVEQIASALDFAHAQGVVHRDIKPANILLSKKRGAILSDFGLVMLRNRLSQQTRGESFGTPEYIAPEQAIDSRSATPRSDIYSLGILVYELTTGRLPFDADSALSMALMHIGQEPTRPRKYAPDMPRAVEAAILRAMHKEPNKRYASAGEMAAALRAAYGNKLAVPARSTPKLVPEPAPSRRPAKRRLLAWAFASLLLLTTGLFLATRGNDTFLSRILPAVGSETSASTGLSAGTQELRPVDQMTLCFIPGGRFSMGSPDDDPDARPHERPQHTVNLSPFWLDQTQVTNDQYRLCVEADACRPPVLPTWFDEPAYADHPVVHVTWDHAAAYCNWLADETGWPVALPTEAQWEKAAAWDPKLEYHRRYPWGDQAPTTNLANLKQSHSEQTVTVDSYPDGASYYGILNLAGNVWEWVADWYDQGIYATAAEVTDPAGPATGSQHVIRGGSYSFGAVEARAAHRTAGGLQANGSGLGFRCAVNGEKLP